MQILKKSILLIMFFSFSWQHLIGNIGLQRAIDSSDISAIQKLLSRGADIDAKDKNESTIFHGLSSPVVGKVLVDWIKKEGKDPAKYINVINKNDRTPLDNVVNHENLPMINFLLENGADIDVKDENESTIFHYLRSPVVGKVLVDWIKKEGKDPAQYINAKDKFGRTPLSNAVGNKNLPMITFLLENGADLDTKDENKNTIFHDSSSPEVGKAFVDGIKKQGKDPAQYINAKNKNGATWLSNAVRSKDVPIIEFLLENGADIDAKDNNENTIFHNLNSPEVGKILIDWIKKEDKDSAQYINAKNKNGATWLSNAVRSKDVPIIELLLKNGADIDAKDENDNTIFHALRSPEVGKILVDGIKEQGNDPAQYINAKNKNGNTSLFEAMGSNDLPMIKFLLENGADIDVKNNNGWTPLRNAVGRGDLPMIEFLLENGADIDVKDENGNTIFHGLRSPVVGKALVDGIKKQGKDPSQYINTKDNNGKNILDLAMDVKNLPMIEFLLNNGADINEKHEHGETSLLRALSNVSIENDYIDFLIEKGADIKARNNDGWTIFHYVLAFAFSKEKEDTLVKIVEERDISQLLDKTDNFNRTPLFCALDKGFYKLASALEEKGAPLFINSPQKPFSIPFSIENPELMVKILFNVSDQIEQVDPATKKRVFGEILLPSILFQYSACFPIIDKAGKRDMVLKLFDQFLPKSTVVSLRNMLPVKQQNRFSHLAIAIDQNHWGEIAPETIAVMSLGVEINLENASAPGIVIGVHMLRKALAMLKARKVDVSKTFHFFSIKVNDLPAYLFIPKRYLEGPDDVKSLGFNKEYLEYKKFDEVVFPEKLAYVDFPRDAFGKKSVDIISKVLLEDEKKERIVYVGGHGGGLYSSGKETDPSAAGLPLDAFLDVIEVLENRKTRFVQVITCYMGGANLSALQNFVTEDSFYTSLAKKIEVRQRVSKMFISSLATADVTSYGTIRLEPLFSGIEAFFSLLYSPAIKDIVPNMQAWITRMLRTFGFYTGLTNYPQVRMPGKATNFCVTNIHGDLQVINKFTGKVLVRSETKGEVTQGYIPLSIKSEDIHVKDKQLLVTYISDIESKIILEGHLPAILAAGTNFKTRHFKEIDIDIPDVGLYLFAKDCFYKSNVSSDFGEDMAHRETYLIDKLSFKTEDVFKDMELPEELKDYAGGPLYNFIIRRGLDLGEKKSPEVYFSLQSSPDADIFGLYIEDDEIFIRKVDDTSWIQAEILALKEGIDVGFNVDQIKFLTKPDLFMKENAQELDKVLPAMLRNIVMKSIMHEGKYIDRILYTYLLLLGDVKTRDIVENYMPTILKKCKGLDPRVRLALGKTLIRRIDYSNEDMVANTRKLIEEIFGGREKMRDELIKELDARALK